MRNLERDEQEYELKLAALRAAIDEGDGSGITQAAGGIVVSRVLHRRMLPERRSMAEGNDEP